MNTGPVVTFYALEWVYLCHYAPAIHSYDACVLCVCLLQSQGAILCNEHTEGQESLPVGYVRSRGAQEQTAVFPVHPRVQGGWHRYTR